MKNITLHADVETHQRYLNVKKSIKLLGIDIVKTIPFFLLDALESDARRGFKLIKKIWEKNAARKLV